MFVFSAWILTKSGSLASRAMSDGLKVSRYVASHINDSPFFQGIMEVQSGFFPSKLAMSASIIHCRMSGVH